MTGHTFKELLKTFIFGTSIHNCRQIIRVKSVVNGNHEKGVSIHTTKELRRDQKERRASKLISKLQRKWLIEQYEKWELTSMEFGLPMAHKLTL